MAARVQPIYTNENNGNNEEGEWNEEYGGSGNMPSRSGSNSGYNSAEEFMNAQRHLHGLRPAELYNIQNRTLRGIGSYGAVLSPAVNNIIHENPQRFTNKVTKLVFTKNAYKKTLRNSDIIKETLPELSYNIEPYIRNIKLGNIQNGKLKTILSKKLEKRHATKITNATPLYGVHMNDMGYDLFDIYNYDALQEKLVKVPFVTIVEEMRNIAENVRVIYNAGYVHGDIRDKNILCDVKTGKLQIIDFDFLHTIAGATDDDYVIRYSCPIEAYIINNKDGIFDSIIDIYARSDNDKDVIREQVQTLYDTQISKHIIKHYDYPTDVFINTYCIGKRGKERTQYISSFVLEMANDYRDGIYELLIQKVNNDDVDIDKELKSIYNKTCDSHGLGMGFIYLISAIQQQVYDDPEYSAKLRRLWEIAMDMISANFMRRVTIEDVIAKLDDIITEEDDDLRNRNDSDNEYHVLRKYIRNRSHSRRHSRRKSRRVTRRKKSSEVKRERTRREGSRERYKSRRTARRKKYRIHDPNNNSNNRNNNRNNE
jgi:hypothetical protein